VCNSDHFFLKQVDGAESAPPRDAELWGQAKVDMKKFSRFLGAHHVNPAAVVCCIHAHKALVMVTNENRENIETSD
jgi:hypothetical protein